MASSLGAGAARHSGPRRRLRRRSGESRREIERAVSWKHWEAGAAFRENRTSAERQASRRKTPVTEPLLICCRKTTVSRLITSPMEPMAAPFTQGRTPWRRLRNEGARARPSSRRPARGRAGEQGQKQWGISWRHSKFSTSANLRPAVSARAVQSEETCLRGCPGCSAPVSRSSQDASGDGGGARAEPDAGAPMRLNAPCREARSGRRVKAGREHHSAS